VNVPGFALVVDIDPTSHAWFAHGCWYLSTLHLGAGNSPAAEKHERRDVKRSSVPTGPDYQQRTRRDSQPPSPAHNVNTLKRVRVGPCANPDGPTTTRRRPARPATSWPWAPHPIDRRRSVCCTRLQRHKAGRRGTRAQPNDRGRPTLGRSFFDLEATAWVVACRGATLSTRRHYGARLVQCYGAMLPVPSGAQRRPSLLLAPGSWPPRRPLGQPIRPCQPAAVESSRAA
jgi:hypothetical protein